ncbi:OpgC domain-containing protein [Vibrio sp. YMD68]|uniref:OpgC domain-containing protein n=1 Tax=Vibrio sp. YMD68 TaxID=3042300 RepID=UPI00249AD683|nr:OpgC domain-containing protein [Vibrio sp. YMD68]WGV98596.1 OpgC domain-containing protein [Vibrio sp. YMD68]
MKRNHAIASIRGLLLICMALNHFIWMTGGRSVIQVLTLQPLGQVGAAEGFIFISGLMVGLIYCRPSATQITRKIFTRVKQLYYYHIGALALIVGIILMVSYGGVGYPSFFQSMFPFLFRQPELATAMTLALIHKPAYFDILPMYIAFMLCTPMVIHSLNKGKIIGVITVSLVIWLSSSWVNLSQGLSELAPITPINTGYFSWLAWQLPFVMGVCLGYSHHHVSIAWFQYKRVVVAAFIIAFVLFLAHHNVFYPSLGIHQGTLYQYADKPTLGWLRVLNMSLLIYLFSYLIQRWPNGVVIRPFALLGRHSLQVFTWHYVVIFTLTPFCTQFVKNNGLYHSMLIVVVLLLFLPPLMREKHLLFRRFTFNRSI